MDIQRIAIEKLNPAPYNPRKDLKPGDPEYEKLKRSIDRWDMVEPLVWNEKTGHLVGGHQRLKILKARGDTETEVSVVSLTADDEAALNIALNNIEGAWDLTKLSEVLTGLDANGYDLTLTGFDIQELEDLLTNVGPDPDENIPEPPANPESKLGEVYELGPHRLMCGDATNAEHVATLMAGERAVACVTDPPYSVNYGESHKQRGGDASVHAGYVEGASTADASDVLAFMGLVPADVMVWSYPLDRHFQALAIAYREYGWEFRKELVWVKNTFSFWPGAKFQQKHEPIMIAARVGKPINSTVPANETTVRIADKPHAHNLHPTAKPMEIWAPLVRFHVPSGGLVYDPFVGSGTTLIAAEMTKRICYAMEIDPGYCDVVRQRYKEFTDG